MNKIIDISVPPEVAYDSATLNDYIRRAAHLPTTFFHKVVRRSIDARGKSVKVVLKVRVTDSPVLGLTLSFDKNKLPYVGNAPEVAIVGFGPAGMFAALKLIELGLKPVVFERGKDVRSRRRDIAAINKAHVVNPDSNYCFGEGGAGTYSDGKLYTRSTKRGDVIRVLEILVDHGAVEDILIDSHPHIGTNKLPLVVSAIRETILQHGGIIHFDTKVSDIIIKNQGIKGLKLDNGATYTCNQLILTTGHSARDIFHTLQRNKVLIEPKPFALGVRVEHPQALIDRIQYHCTSRYPLLPAASYSLVAQTYTRHGHKGVFSFCMCPGGFIVPAATEPGEVVVNGMSPSRRDSKYANSGIVVQVDAKDWQRFVQSDGALASMSYQSAIEQKACELAGGNQTAPAQRLTDFLNNRVSQSLPSCTYQPGLAPVKLSDLFPENIYLALCAGFNEFGRKMKGYITEEAIVVGVESRTSSPVKIPRDHLTLQHPQIEGLYPGGEGAGYAGGIMSAAMDGERLAQAVWKQMIHSPNLINQK